MAVSDFVTLHPVELAWPYTPRKIKIKQLTNYARKCDILKKGLTWGIFSLKVKASLKQSGAVVYLWISIHRAAMQYEVP